MLYNLTPRLSTSMADVAASDVAEITQHIAIYTSTKQRFDTSLYITVALNLSAWWHILRSCY